MKRRLLMAKALVHQPPIVFLDEPTAGVDVELRQNLWKNVRLLNDLGVTIILTTHYLEEAEQLCRNIAIIAEGNIVENTSMKLLLAELDSQIFVFDSTNELESDFEIDLEGVSVTVIDSHTFELTVPAVIQINQVFASLDRKSIPVRSMRNKTNRLEQLFLAKLNN